MSRYINKQHFQTILDHIFVSWVFEETEMLLVWDWNLLVSYLKKVYFIRVDYIEMFSGVCTFTSHS